jgi:ElaB/YqjD/DUF883 family membrane-anchored ribosome-binding protein
MTREELLALVNKEVDTTKFKELSQKTINEELDDVLEDFGDDEEANSKLVTKLANRLKRINGNLHKNISDEVKKSKEEAERKKKEEDSDDRGFKLLPKKIAKKYVGHSPDFFESWFYVMIFSLTKKKNKKVKGLWMLSR